MGTIFTQDRDGTHRWFFTRLGGFDGKVVVPKFPAPLGALKLGHHTVLLNSLSFQPVLSFAARERQMVFDHEGHEPTRQKNTLQTL